MRLRLLSEQNPWWRSPADLDRDPVLLALAEQAVQWTPRMLPLFRLDRDRVYTLRGPRQVGKTTLVKMLVRRLLREDGVDPRAVFYFSCDLLRDAAALDDLVETYLRWQAPFRLPRRHVFLDEVSSVRDWSVAVRALANRGRLRGSTVVVTGSHALDVARQVERLPGRRGESPDAGPEDPLDKVLLPMKFAEFAETVRPEVRDALRATRERRVRFPALDSLFAGKPSRAWSELRLVEEEAQSALADYMLTGGFPRPVGEFHRTGRIARETYELYVRAVTGDLVRWGHDERTARELLAAIVEKLGTPVSWHTLADETDVGSHNTIARYVETLERTYTVQTVYQYDVRRKRPNPRKQRKLYIPDPFMFHALRAWALGLADPFEAARSFVDDPPRRGPFLEGIVADHLARLAFAAAPSAAFDAYEHVLFWRSAKGWEVDFVLRVGPKPRAIQVTTSRPRSETLRAMRAFGGGLVLTEAGEADTVPLAPFLLLA